MKYPATITAAAIAAFLIGLSFALKPKPDAEPSEPTPLSIEAFAEYQALLKQINSLEYDVKNLQAECLTYKSQRDELQAARVDDLTKIESLAVQLAESQKARQRPESLPVGEPACAEVPNFAPAVPSVVPSDRGGWGSQRRRLFGRFR